MRLFVESPDQPDVEVIGVVGVEIEIPDVAPHVNCRCVVFDPFGGMPPGTINGEFRIVDTQALSEGNES